MTLVPGALRQTEKWVGHVELCTAGSFNCDLVINGTANGPTG